ncbi:pseudaminic acid synthase [Puniceicoccaceae bacterium K14]|nr:pseudaminic acid synthase [Puniceicoccaceae bacterium K14]
MSDNLADRILDTNKPPTVIAEMSGNHAQSYETAETIVRLAAKSGADAVKLQTYTADTLTLPSKNEEFMVRGGLWDGRSLYELYQEAATPYEWHEPLAKLARSLSIEILSTPFDETSVDFIEETLQPQIYKVSSFEVTHIPLLEKVGQQKKLTLLSTGMATEGEIEEAIAALKDNGCPDVVLLKCISSYPAQPKSFNLNSITTLAKRFNCPTGLSDHCITNEIAIASVALGARVIEKHFTDDRAAGGIDAGFSIEPDEFAQLVTQARNTHAALGCSQVGTTQQDVDQTKFRRSIYVSKNINKDEILSIDNLKIVRPSFGLPPKEWKNILGKRANKHLEAGTPLKQEDIL